METIAYLLDVFLHLNTHLDELVRNYGPWVYLILFLIIFCETGLVVTPFLPGDSLLFAVGALAASPNGLNLWILMAILILAAIMGDGVNYWIGYFLGDKLQKRFPRLIKPKYIEKTHAFYERYGGKTIIIARFVPIIRTFAPFVAGIGKMTYSRFTVFNVSGALLWIGLLVSAGYAFGDLEIVRKNFSLVILAIIILSVLPGVIEIARYQLARYNQSKISPRP